MSNVSEYNAILDFCRSSWQRKHNIQEALGIEQQRLGTLLQRLVKRGFIEYQHPNTNLKVYEYMTKPNAVYFEAKRDYSNNGIKTKTSGIKIEGNVTTVSCNAYHSTGNKTKRSVWIGSTANLI